MSDRKILRLTGSEVRPFLQGLITNDINRIDAGLVYAALLTPQGKYIADFFLLADKEDVLLDIDASLAEPLKKRLMMYKLRANVDITETGLGVRRGVGDFPPGALPDPRHSAMGWRLYSETSDVDGNIDWTAARVEHCIPETGIELTPDTFILEAGFEALNGVDFKKGCYVGQEVTARMKHKTELRKGLRRVRVTGAAQTGADIMASGKPAGTLLSRAGNEAIAYLRFDRAKGPMTAEDATVELI